MSRSRKVRISPAMVIALVALLVALGGGAYAAFKLPKNSVGTKQIKKNAVTGSKIKDGSLKPADLGNVVDRARGTGDVTTSASGPVDYPLAKNTWTQQATEPELLIATISFTSPSSCGGIVFPLANISVDGTQVASVFLSQTPAGATQTATATAAVGEPGSATKHTLTATVSGTCSGGGQTYTIHSISVDVLGFG